MLAPPAACLAPGARELSSSMPQPPKNTSQGKLLKLGAGGPKPKGDEASGKASGEASGVASSNCLAFQLVAAADWQIEALDNLPEYLRKKQQQTSQRHAPPAADTPQPDASTADSDPVQPVHLKMALSMDFSEAGAEGSVERETFTRTVIEDLASASGMPPSSFCIKGLSAGSVVIEMEILQDSSGVLPADVASKLERQAADSSSALRSGKLTSKVKGMQVLLPTALPTAATHDEAHDPPTRAVPSPSAPGAAGALETADACAKDTQQVALIGYSYKLWAIGAVVVFFLATLLQLSWPGPCVHEHPGRLPVALSSDAFTCEPCVPCPQWHKRPETRLASSAPMFADLSACEAEATQTQHDLTACHLWARALESRADAALARLNSSIEKVSGMSSSAGWRGWCSTVSSSMTSSFARTLTRTSSTVARASSRVWSTAASTAKSSTLTRASSVSTSVSSSLARASSSFVSTSAMRAAFTGEPFFLPSTSLSLSLSLSLCLSKSLSLSTPSPSLLLAFPLSHLVLSSYVQTRSAAGALARVTGTCLHVPRG